MEFQDIDYDNKNLNLNLNQYKRTINKRKNKTTKRNLLQILNYLNKTDLKFDKIRINENINLFEESISLIVKEVEILNSIILNIKKDSKKFQYDGQFYILKNNNDIVLNILITNSKNNKIIEKIKIEKDLNNEVLDLLIKQINNFVNLNKENIYTGYKNSNSFERLLEI
jgi:hypothetical protein